MNTSDAMTKEFSIIGCGRTGISLAVFLSRQGYSPVGFCSKSPASAQKAYEAVGRQGEIVEDPVLTAGKSRLLFITTPDTVIEPVCEQIAGNNGFNEDSIIMHLSGALSYDILKTAKESGAQIGSIHPLQAFAPYEDPEIAVVTFVYDGGEGSEAAVPVTQKILETYFREISPPQE